MNQWWSLISLSLCLEETGQITRLYLRAQGLSSILSSTRFSRVSGWKDSLYLKWQLVNGLKAQWPTRPNQPSSKALVTPPNLLPTCSSTPPTTPTALNTCSPAFSTPPSLKSTPPASSLPSTTTAFTTSSQWWTNSQPVLTSTASLNPSSPPTSVSSTEWKVSNLSLLQWTSALWSMATSLPTWQRSSRKEFTGEVTPLFRLCSVYCKDRVWLLGVCLLEMRTSCGESRL